MLVQDLCTCWMYFLSRKQPCQSTEGGREREEGRVRGREGGTDGRREGRREGWRKRHCHLSIFSCRSTRTTITNTIMIVVKTNKNPPVRWHWWLGDRKGIWCAKSWVLVCWWWRFDWSFATLNLQLSPSPPSSLAPTESRLETLLVPANSGLPGKKLLKLGEKES